ncbi:hypothetical protein HGRIS_013422 [Hohenbuehelia grisea]|uniref:DUF6697 domain-containing protein n=1 Tax=Hohenbuehelia grisea TaxID=104357 RepID=A0ABR3IVQ1_9AGAR
MAKDEHDGSAALDVRLDHKFKEEDLNGDASKAKPLQPEDGPPRLATPVILNWKIGGNDPSERARHAAWCAPGPDESKPPVEVLEAPDLLGAPWTALADSAPSLPIPSRAPSVAEIGPELLNPASSPEPSPQPSQTHLDRNSPRRNVYASLDGPDETSRPRKRPRLELFVELPTLDSVYRRSGVKVKNEPQSPPPMTRIEDFKDFKHLRHPLVKVKQNMELSFFSVKDRYQAAGISGDLKDLDGDHDFLHFSVPRTYISHLYGGNTQQTFPDIAAEKLAEHGLDDFMFPNPTYNPHVALLPGAPGLFFAALSCAARPWPKVQRVIVRIKPGHWLYVGQCKFTPARSLSKEEWLMQDLIVRRTWAQQIHIRGWGTTVRSRIILRRRLGREPTPEEQEEAYKSEEKWMDITEEEIVEAMDQGLEFLCVWCMECVGYDTEFQKNLIAKYPAWEAGERIRKEAQAADGGARKGKGAGKGTGKRKGKGKGRSKKPEPKETRKRKHREPFDDEDSDEDSELQARADSDSVESGDEADLEPVYRPRGTKSRPILL